MQKIKVFPSPWRKWRTCCRSWLSYLIFLDFERFLQWSIAGKQIRTVGMQIVLKHIPGLSSGTLSQETAVDTTKIVALMTVMCGAPFLCSLRTEYWPSQKSFEPCVMTEGLSMISANGRPRISRRETPSETRNYLSQCSPAVGLQSLSSCWLFNDAVSIETI
jgi:hypothetical protein